MRQVYEIYRVMLELKETAGKTEAGIDDIIKSIVDHSIANDKLREEHRSLKESHDSLKGKVLWVSGLVGTVFGAFTAWLKIEWNKIFG